MRIVNPFSRQTRVDLDPLPNPFNHNASFCSIGSCFADHINLYFSNHLVNIQHNPYGITYNPYSIGRQIRQCLDQKIYTDNDIFEYNGLYHSYEHHGSFSDPDPDKLLRQIDIHQTTFTDCLKYAQGLMLTLGTAFVFRHKTSQHIVNNCHKIPGHEFDRYKLSIEDIIKSLQPAFEACLDINPDLKIILTVSPVRHTRDGLVANQRSKATLLLAVEQLSKLHDAITYFPSYEICMDELRDYRFYAEDLIHPSSVAVQYIVDQFVANHFGDEAQKYFISIGKIRKQLNHRPLHPDREEYQDFVRKLRSQIKDLEERYPEKDFTWLNQKLEGK